MKCVWWAVLVLALGGRGQARAPRPVCPPEAGRCVIGNEEYGLLNFFINETNFAYKFTDGEFFVFECSRGKITLDEPWLPRFEPALHVREVRLRCPPPTISYEAALSALNVTALEASSLDTAQVPPTYSIILEIYNVENFEAKLLAASPALRDLTITHTKVTADDLTQLPDSLKYLKLDHTNIGSVPATVFTRLPALANLDIDESKPVMVEAAGNLRRLKIFSYSTLVSLTLPDLLQWFSMFGWALARPEPWRSCAGLDYLHLYSMAAEMLPDAWLARCGQLRTLIVSSAKKLRTLAARALRGATALEVVDISRCPLEALPAGLFDDAHALIQLKLMVNSLHTLPVDLFKPTKSLSYLDLSYNHLNDSVLSTLHAVTSLNVLRLDLNRALDACPDTRDTRHITIQGSSALGSLKNLMVLSLSYTGTTRVCRDWRQLPRLQEIDLHDTNTTQLTYTDLWFNNTGGIRVVLDSMNLSFRREDYDIVAAAPATPSVTLHLWSPLSCDCELYWAMAALRRPDTFLSVQGGTCENGHTLSKVPLDKFVCPAPGPCPDGCSCGVREDIAIPGRVLMLDCAGGELLSMPHVDTGSESFALDLRVARNRIYRFSSDDLPPGLVRLDLRSNSLELIDNATASALVSRADRRVLLANNPLECGCRAAAALATMRNHPDIFPDWDNATCANGTALSLAMPLPCDDDPKNVTTSVSGVSGMSGGAVAALVVSVVAVTALAMSLGWLSLRRRLRALPSELQPAACTSQWLYDAFVSFAHADEAKVLELVERLEGGAEPFRLCVHYRDWMPGGWIPAQIAASVRVSRRTVAVVSEAYLRSKWARAEVREAYAAAVESAEPRLILVFLEDPAQLQLDVELRTYVAGNTYVCWGDRWFWQKLRRALPDPLPRQSDNAGAHARSSSSEPTPAPPFMEEIELASIEPSPE